MLSAVGCLVSLRAAVGAEGESAFKDDREKGSYAIGLRFGEMIKTSYMDVDLEVMLNAMKDALASRDLKLTAPQVADAIKTFQQESSRKVADKNIAAAQAFLDENKKKPGIKVQTVSLPDGSTAELQYKVITEGTGAAPKSNDTVTVNYRTTLLDGKEVDSSAKRGQPGKYYFPGRMFKAWAAAIEQMKVGSKWEVYSPASLAYGSQGNPRNNPPIEPGAGLLFELELLGTEPYQPPPPPQPIAQPQPAQPLTSDIIKVPSAEEMKKGAKIEVIKPEEAARLAQQATNQPPVQPKQ